MSKVTLQGISKNFGKQHILANLSLEVEDREFLVLVGPSGCGKSTLLRIIAGLEDVDHGSVEIGNLDVTDLEPRERDIAMVFQSYALYPHLSVRDNIGFSLKLAGKPKPEIKAAVDEATKLLNLTNYLDRKPRALSGGQRQRVAMGRAIVRKPKLFLFDEPLSNLDAKLRVQMRTDIRALHDRLGATSIYVTHDQVEAMTMADRIVVLDRGRIVQQGAPLELYNHPVNRFVAEFIGSPGINILGGEIDRTGAIRYKDWDLGNTKSTQGPINIGIRPEDLHPVVPETPGAIAVAATIVEHLGAETFYFGKIDDQQICWRRSGSSGNPGDLQWLRPDPERIHLFDPETDATIPFKTEV